nr:Rpn family recombination-promoting nuclease/putative transposase [Treponemataceae bacterium]
NEAVINLENGAKGIRLDVYVKDTGRLFDIELQVTDTGELPERARYYASLMAQDSLKSGEKYSELRDSHVIFICMEDIFEKGLPVYSFENICREDGKTMLNDRDYKHFFIAPTCARIIEDEEVKKFFQFLISNRTGDTFTERLENYVTDAKRNMQYRRQFMEWERQRVYDFDAGKKEGIREGVLQGTQAKAEEDALELLKENITVETIAKCVKLPLEKVLELKKQIMAEA